MVGHDAGDEEVGPPKRREPAPPRPRRRGKVAEGVARAIVEEVVHQSVEPGATLSQEAAMAAQYGVARATLREALRLLEMQGLIRLKPGPGGGPMVNELTHHDFARTAIFHLKLRGSTYDEILEARLAIEPMMARVAADNRDPGLIERLTTSIHRAEAEDVANTERFFASSKEFHELVCMGSGNSVLDLLGGALRAIYHGRVSESITPVELRADVVKAHRQILEAIAKGEAELAEILMRSHMVDYDARTRQLYGVGLDRRVDWLDP